MLEPGQVLAQIHLPAAADAENATYEIRQGAGADFPLVSAAAAIRVVGGIVREVKVVLGQVAPTPWNAYAAEEAMIGRPVTLETATAAGEAVAAQATPLSHNEYKVQLASVAVRRALLGGRWTTDRRIRFVARRGPNSASDALVTLGPGRLLDLRTANTRMPLEMATDNQSTTECGRHGPLAVIWPPRASTSLAFWTPRQKTAASETAIAGAIRRRSSSARTMTSSAANHCVAGRVCFVPLLT